MTIEAARSERHRDAAALWDDERLLARSVVEADLAADVPGELVGQLPRVGLARGRRLPVLDEVVHVA